MKFNINVVEMQKAKYSFAFMQNFYGGVVDKLSDGKLHIKPLQPITSSSPSMSISYANFHEHTTALTFSDLVLVNKTLSIKDIENNLFDEFKSKVTKSIENFYTKNFSDYDAKIAVYILIAKSSHLSSYQNNIYFTTTFTQKINAGIYFVDEDMGMHSNY